MTNFTDVGDFHRKFGLHTSDDHPGPVEVSLALYGFRYGFLLEELEEFKDAVLSGDMAGAADALVDLVYVAMGTAHLFGFPWQTLWDAVQAANMAKQRAVRPEQSRRGSTYDVVKPEGWMPPDIEGILKAYGWNASSEHGS